MNISFHMKYPLFLSDFNLTWIFQTARQISKNTQIQNLMKICPVDAELFHADGQTDMKKLTFALCNITNAPKMTSLCGNYTKILFWKMFWRENTNCFLIELMFWSEPSFFGKFLLSPLRSEGLAVSIWQTRPSHFHSRIFLVLLKFYSIK
jgi:hypothetical protein